MTATTCQRWRERRDSYRPAGEPIDPTRYGDGAKLASSPYPKGEVLVRAA